MSSSAGVVRCGELACQKNSYLRSMSAARVVACKPRAAAPAAPKGKGDKKKGASHEPQQVYRLASSVCGSSMRLGNMHVSMCGHERMHVCMPAIAGAIAGLCARVSLGVRACVCTH